MRHQLHLLIDIIECDDDNGGCSQTCSNTDGSFECECYDGYDFTENSTTDCIGKFWNFISNAVTIALLSRIHPSSKWLSKLSALLYWENEILCLPGFL